MRSLLAGLLAVAAAAGIALIAGQPVQAAARVEISLIDCAKHPGLLDLVFLKNTGDAPQDLAGWRLVSDPEATQQMSLTRVGTLDPGEEIYVVAGQHGVDRPEENTYLWSNDEILRDSGDPPDYVRVLDASGNQVTGMNCLGQPLQAPTPTATLATQTPEPSPTPAPQSTGAVQNGLTGPQATQAGSGGSSGASAQQDGATGQTAAASGAAPQATGVGGAPAAPAGAPSSGIGSLAPTPGLPLTGWLLLALGLAGLGTGAAMAATRLKRRD